MRQALMQPPALSVALLLCLGTVAGHAQAPTRGAMAQATAVIYQPVSIQKPADLNFGAMLATPSAGKVVLGPEGARSATGGAVLASAAGVAATSFLVTGEPNATFSQTLPASVLIVSGSQSLLVDAFTTATPTTRLAAKGTLALHVDATLELAAKQAPGLYSGSFIMTVADN